MSPRSKEELGKPVAIFPLAPAYIQRAVILIVLSFLFFMAMMFTYYIRASGLYFLLATAFLILYLVTLISFVTQRKTQLKIFENGFAYKTVSVLWTEMTTVDEDGTIVLAGGKRITVSTAINDRDKALAMIRSSFR